MPVQQAGPDCPGPIGRRAGQAAVQRRAPEGASQGNHCKKRTEIGTREYADAGTGPQGAATIAKAASRPCEYRDAKPQNRTADLGGGGQQEDEKY